MKAEVVNKNRQMQEQRNRVNTAWCLSDSSREQNCPTLLAAKVKISTCNATDLSLERLSQGMGR